MKDRKRLEYRSVSEMVFFFVVSDYYGVGVIIDCRKFGSYGRFLRVIVLVLNVVERFKLF